MSRSRRQRIRIALGLVLCLLFQHVALAAYACAMERVPTAAPSAMADCPEMQAQTQPELPALCEKHCAPDLTILSDHAAPHIPALSLPPIAFELVLASPVAADAARHVPISRSDPPPRLRFCSLLI